MSKPLGLIGFGLVGQALAECLQRRGYALRVSDPAPGTVVAAARLGVAVVDSGVEVAREAGLVLLSLPDSEVVGQVLWQEGVAEALVPGAVVLDTTTGSPGAAADNARRLARRQVHFVDVTLSGSSAEIARGEATALIGAESGPHDYDPVVAAFAGRVMYLGRPGAGCLAKLVTNHVMGLNRAALAEGLALGLKAGLPADTLLEVLRESAAYSRVLDLKGRRMIEGDYAPASRLRQHAKDVRLILALAAEVGARCPLEETHAALLAEAVSHGWGELDNAALIKAYLEPET
jgi:3-hydroxyisobutyrate dehydrogenase-like beta-hydroxyacid dehydrogenase